MGPDLNTSEQTMAWMMDTYSVNVGYTVPSIVTGKPKSIGGSLGMLEATGYGVSLCTQKLLKDIGMTKNEPDSGYSRSGKSRLRNSQKLNQGWIQDCWRQ